MDKRSSLLGKFINYGPKKFYRIDPRGSTNSSQTFSRQRRDLFDKKFTVVKLSLHYGDNRSKLGLFKNTKNYFFRFFLMHWLRAIIAVV